jgi:spore maturation protein CgeB
MKILVVLPRYQYADESRGETHEYSSFYTAIYKSFQEVYYFDTARYIRKSNISDLNYDLLKLQCERGFTNLFIVQWGNEFFPETIALLRSTGATVINWATDDSYRFDTFTKFIANRFDYTITTEFQVVKQYKKIGASCIKGHWGYSEQWKRPPISARECIYDVAFIGVNYFDRKKYIDYLRDKGINIFVGGYGWGKLGSIVVKENIPKIYNSSKIVINFSKSIGGRQTKARIFESIAAGSCLLTEDSADLFHYFSIGKELLTFQSEVDCYQKVVLLLNNYELRNQIANSGYIRCIQNYSYEKQFKTILNNIPKNYRISTVNQLALESYFMELKNPKLSRKIFRALLFHSFVPAIARKVVRKLEEKFFKKNYLSADSYSIN